MFPVLILATTQNTIILTVLLCAFNGPVQPINWTSPFSMLGVSGVHFYF